MQGNPPNSIYKGLQSERQILKFEALAIADATLPERIVLVSTVRSNEPPVGIAVHQRGPGTNDCIQIIIHGVLANHESWRYLTGPLSSNFDLWIIDLPGCGDSDKPDPKSLAADGYSPDAMADRVMQAIEQCLAARNDSPHLMLVAHSFGGMIVLRMTSDPELRQRHATLLRQVDGLVLFAPCDVNVNQVNPVFKPIIKLGGLKAGIGDALGILREAAAKSKMNGFCSPRLASKETADQLYHALSNADERRAARAMLIEAVPWNYKENRPDWDGIHQLEANYRNVDKPCLIVWGACDEVLPESMGYKLAAEIAGAKLVVLPDCMHAIALECPDACARLIRDFHASVRTACKREMPLPANSQIANDASSTTSTFYMANPKN
jgi:pimeloyl-ACP methyl ester carboxylesterase